MEPKQPDSLAPPPQPPNKAIRRFIKKTFEHLFCLHHDLSMDENAQRNVGVKISKLDIHSGEREDGVQFLEPMPQRDVQNTMSQITYDEEYEEQYALPLYPIDEYYSTSRFAARVLMNLLERPNDLGDKDGSLIQTANWTTESTLVHLLSLLPLNL